MKLNQELIKRLAIGEIQLQHTGTDEQLNKILHAAFPHDTTNMRAIFQYYERDSNINAYWWCCDNIPSNLPIYTTDDFFEVEHTQVTESTYDPETRELAKQLFVKYSGVVDGAMQIAIKDAKQFIKLLNNE